MRPLSTKGAAPTSLTRVRPSACRNCRRTNSVTRLSKTGSKVSLRKTGTASCSPRADPGFTVVPNSYPQPGSARGLQLAVPVFRNDTFEPVLDKRVTEFVRRQFLQADGLTLVNDVGAAPFVLKGRIRSYGLQTLSFRQGFVNEQRVNIQVEVTFEDTSARKVLWRESYRTWADFFQSNDLATNRDRQDRAT